MIGWVITIVWAVLTIAALALVRGGHIDDNEVPHA